MCEGCNAEREEIAKIALQHPQPCIVCSDLVVAAVGTWIPDERHKIAAGATDKFHPIFAYWLCLEHTRPSEENEKKIMQSVLREIREGNNFEV